ncbi:MAG: bifunctional aminoglycoside phosphotransferase/ATP-binding protein [Solirubrobacteraceae bacterium]
MLATEGRTRGGAYGERMLAAAAADRSGADPEHVRDAIARRCGGEAVTVHQTHISWVFVAGDRAFKLKKPVVLDFLDYGTAARRRAMCHEEVRLNVRLAPELYLGVRAVADRGDRLELADEDDAAAIDYVVEMRRYDEHATLAALADAGRVTPQHTTRVGARLAGFHAECAVALQDRGSRTVRHEVQENLFELADACTDRAMAARTAALGRFLEAWMTAREELLDARGRDGHIREVHGDLRAEHVIVSPRLSVVDCVEFDRDLRTLDVADDLAFLVMDLCARGVPARAGDLVSAYRRAGGDCGPDELLWFFAVHRALIRAKVALVRAGQPGGETGDDAVAALLAVADRCAWRARGAPAVAVCGVPASGKSHLAHALAVLTGCPVISSDVVRKELAGLAVHDRAPEALYSEQAGERTYRELGRRAAAAMSAGRGVLIDATFRRRADRDAFAAGWAQTAPLLFVQCVAPGDVLRRRAAGREEDPDRISDAGAQVVERERHRFEALDEATADRHVIIRTDRDAAAAIADLLALLDVRLAREPAA